MYVRPSLSRLASIILEMVAGCLATRSSEDEQRDRLLSRRDRLQQGANRTRKKHCHMRDSTLNPCDFQYKTEIKKQTGIRADTTKQIEKLSADIGRIQSNYTALEKTDVRQHAVARDYAQRSPCT